MKTLLVLLTFLASQSLYADRIAPIKKGDLSLSQAKGEIVSIRELCPKLPGRIRCSAIGSIVDIEVSLQGCVDRLGGHFTKFQVIDGKGVIFLGAVNISNEVSRRAMCVKAPTEMISIQVPFEGEIELVNLNYIGTALTIR